MRRPRTHERFLLAGLTLALATLAASQERARGQDSGGQKLYEYQLACKARDNCKQARVNANQYMTNGDQKGPLCQQIITDCIHWADVNHAAMGQANWEAVMAKIGMANACLYFGNAAMVDGYGDFFAGTGWHDSGDQAMAEGSYGAAISYYNYGVEKFDASRLYFGGAIGHYDAGVAFIVQAYGIWP